VAEVYQSSSLLLSQLLQPRLQKHTGLGEEVQVYRGERCCHSLWPPSLVMEVAVVEVVQLLVGNLEDQCKVHHID